MFAAHAGFVGDLLHAERLAEMLAAKPDRARQAHFPDCRPAAAASRHHSSMKA